MTTAMAVFPATDSPPLLVGLPFCDWSVAASDVDEDLDEDVDDTDIGFDVSVGVVTEVTVIMTGVAEPPETVAGSVTTDVKIAVDGGIEDAAMEDVKTARLEDAGADDDSSAEDDATGVEEIPAEETETGVELGVKDVCAVVVPLLAAMAGATHKEYYKKRVDRSCLALMLYAATR